MKNLKYTLRAGILSVCLLLTGFVKANDTLIAVVDGQLISINQNDAGYVNFTSLANLPVGHDAYRLTWSERDQCFYTINRPGTTSNEIAKIDINGQFTVLGAVTIPADTVYFLEGISFSDDDNFLYVSGSMDGNVPSDYWSESIIKVDPITLIGTVLGEVTHNGVNYQAEADMIEVIGGTIYYIDSEGNGSFNRVYSQDIDFINPPVLLFDDPNLANSSGITVKGGELFYTVGRELRKIDLISGSHSIIGDVFSSSDFNGKIIWGLDWLPSGSSSIQTELVDIEVEVYPNPSSDIFNITIDSDETGVVMVYDMNGKTVYKGLTTGRITQLSLGALPVGTYNLWIQLNSNGISERIIIQ